MIVPIRELGGGARQGIRRTTMVLSFTPVKVGDYYSLLYNCPSSRSVGLFFARSVTETSIHTTLLFNIVPGPYPYAQPPSPRISNFTTHIPLWAPLSRHFRVHFPTMNHTNDILLNHPSTRTLLLLDQQCQT